MLSPDQVKQQLATELGTALEQAKKAKASGNKEHKRVAGEAVRQIKQELASSGFKEAEIHALIAEQQKRNAGPPAAGAPLMATAALCCHMHCIGQLRMLFEDVGECSAEVPSLLLLRMLWLLTAPPWSGRCAKVTPLHT